VLADVMLGTGRYNAARGVLGTVQGIAGSLSNAAPGFLVVSAWTLIRRHLGKDRRPRLQPS
jgi:hypothetical protein